MFRTKKNIIALFLAVIFIFSLVFSVNAETKYKDWTDVSNAMEKVLRNAMSIYKDNGHDSWKDAYDEVDVAYFKFYEKLGFEKIVMSTISGARGSEVEHQFYLAKKSIKDGEDYSKVEEDLETLIRFLHEDAQTLDDARGVSSSSKDGKSSGSAAMGVFVSVLGLTLREGLEAILVIAAIAAYLVKTGNQAYLKGVYGGAALGVVFSVILAVIFNVIAASAGDAASGVGQEVFEGVAMFLAVAVLFYVSNWMLSKSEVEVWNQYIKNKVSQSLTRGNVIALAFSSFLAVAREGAELILFFQGMRDNISNNPTYMWGALAVAVVILAIIYVLITKVGVRLPLKPFFMATSILMFILCISFMGKGVYELQEANVVGRTIITGMNGFTIDLLGIYDRLETLLPQIILLVITIITVIVQLNKNKKQLEELKKAN